MAAGCPSSNTFPEYKDTILSLVGKDYSGIFTDDFVQKSLETQAADWLLKNGVTDQVEAQKKAILLRYITYNTNFDEQTNIRVFIPQEAKKKLGQELVDLPLNERAVKEWIDKVNKEIIRESIISLETIDEDLSTNEKLSNVKTADGAEQQKNKKDDLNVISAEKIKSTHILSNYNGASDGLFDNKGNVSIKDIFSNPETEAVIVFTQDRTEKNLSVSKQKYENNQRNKDNKIILRINPSDDEIKRIIKSHNGIGVICGKGVPHRKIDNLYQNVKLEYTEQGQFNGNQFFDNYIMLAYERKIDYLYSQNKNADWTREQIMEKVLDDLRKEYNEMSEEERNDTDKGHYIGELINNFQYVSTLVTVNEEIDDFELEEYDDENADDPLWSEQHSTSNMPKEGILKGLLSSFETGKEDWLGTPIMYEPMVINNMLCNVISGSKDSDDMIERMKEASHWNPIFTKIVENLENAGNKRLRSILFTQYANLYKSNYLTVNGNRTIDEGTDFATTSINIGYVSDETKKRFENMGGILNDPSGINSFIQDLQTVHSIDDIERSSDELELHEVYGWTDLDAWREYYLPQATNIQSSGYDLDNNKLRSFLGFIGLETNPDEHDLSKLSNQEMAELKANLGKLYMFRAKSDIDDVRKLKKEYKSVYQPIINILNKIANQKTESIIRTKNQSVFVYADKNYIDTLTDGLHSENKDDFIYEQFLQYELFTSNNGDDRKKLAQGLYSPLLRELALSKNADWFKVQSFFVNKDKKDVKKYSELSPEELHDINHTVFYKEEIANRNRRQQGEREYVYVHAPIYADSGSLHYYRVPKINLWAKDDFDGQYQEPQILTEVKNLIMLETERIKTAKERWKLIENKQLEPIDTYDIMRGKPGKAHKYCFNPMLNEYGEVIENGEKKKVSLYDLIYAPGVTAEQRNQIIHEAACDIIKNVLFQDAEIDKIKTKSNKEVDLRNRMIEHLKKSNFEGWNKALSYFEEKTYRKSKDGTWDGKSYIEGETDYSKIEYALNSYIGQADILQLTISDPALYKDDVDLQKRYKQVQAGYKRPDTKSEYGREWMRTLFIKDNNISLTDKELESMRAFLENARKTAELNINVNDIVDAFKKINVADAQCYRTLSSYRSVRDMFGQWSSKDEELYQKIQNGETLTAEDYTQVWQTLKPFVYTQQDVEWIDGSGTKRHNKVGYQYKNSENVLFNMYMLFSNNKKQKSKLAELNRFMEAYNIDTAQFESAVKVGREGLIDLNDIAADDVFKYLEEKTGVTKTQEQKCKSGLSGNPHVVHEIPYKEYGIKTSTPPHMFDTEQQLGSQLKKLLQGDIPDSPDTKIYLDTEGLLSVVDNATKDKNGKITFKVYGEEITLNEETDKEGRVKRYLKKEDFLKLYNSLMSDMILDEYGDIQDIFKDKNKLSDALQELMKGSPKYDFDIKQALTIDKDGKWTVDPRIPGIKDKVTVLLTSLLKNRINKQLTRGGTAIQMACFDGNVMHDDGEYGPLRIVRNPDGSIDHMECLMPAYSKQFIESMINKDGTLDVKKCKDKNLLKALCYRVPTEDIYSMIPLKIVGFTPMQFGTNIMLPREITTLTGSDFDVDKMYMFFPEFEMVDKWNIDPKIAREKFNKSAVKPYADFEASSQIKKENEIREKKGEPELSEEEIEKIKKRITNDYFNAYCVENKYKIQRPKYITFDSSKDISDNNSAQKRNLLLSLMRGAISSPYNITKEQNPGGFDYLKDIANEVNDELEIPMNLTEKQYLNFFNLNMTGKRLIGIYANHNVAHALCQGSNLQLKKPVVFNGKKYQSFGNIYDTSGRRISRNIAEFLAASVDNAKDPVLAKLWQNDHTASATCFLLRLGVPIKEIIDCFKQHHKEKKFGTFMKYGPSALKDENLNVSYDITQQSNLYAFLGMYADTIQNIETLNLFLKADSTNGAMYDLSDIIDKTIKLNNLRADGNLVGVDSVLPDFDEDENILRKSKDEIVEDLKKQGGTLNSYKTAFYLTYCNYKQYFGEIVDTTLLNKTIQFGQQFKFFTADNIKKFMAEYSKYQLRYLDYFKPKVKYNKETGKYDITSTQDIINNTLKSIPEKFDYYKTKYKDNEFIKMLTLSDDGYLMINNIADMRLETVNAVKAGFNELISNDESYQDANDLLHYTLCVNGFGYDPRSFISLIPLKSIAQLKGINSLTHFFEIDNIDRFEDQFILDNDLEQSISYKDYREARQEIKDGMIPFKHREKIIKVPEYNNEETGQHRAAVYLKKCYEAEDGYSYYKLIKVNEQTISKEGMTNDGDSYNYKKIEKKLSKRTTGIQADIYKILDEDLVSLDTQPDDFDALAESIIKGFNESNADLSVINKDTVLKVLKSTKLGRYFNINSDPMTDYEPIQVDFC